MLFEDLIKIKPVAGQEEDFRSRILNALLNTPHKDFTLFVPLFRHVHDHDPVFFARLAVWYVNNGTVRDLKHLFIALLCTSKVDEKVAKTLAGGQLVALEEMCLEFREAGLAMLSKLPPFQVAEVHNLIKGYMDRSKKFVPGLIRNVPRSFRGAIEDYLREREEKPEWFYSVALRSRSDLLKLYASHRIKPGEIAQKVLFEKYRPEGSQVEILKRISDSNDPSEQARLIVEHKIPYTTAVGVIKDMTPAIVGALVGVMSSQELINNMASLSDRGALNNPDIKKLIESKLETAKKDTKVATMKTRVAVNKANLSEDMAQKVKDVGDARLKTMGKITKSTALFVDKSISMQSGIEVSKTLASMIAPICVNELFVYTFDSIPKQIKPKGNELSDWEKAFAGVMAGGQTAAETPIKAMAKAHQRAEQFIWVTDQEENGNHSAAEVLKAYARELNIEPNVVIVHVGGRQTIMQDRFKHLGIECEVFKPSTDKSDYYSLPSLIPMLTQGSRLELLMSIMELDLPKRKKTLAREAALA